MNRVKTNSLTYIKNKFYYQESLFTGIAFNITGEIVSIRTQYLDGIQKGQYINQFFPDKKIQLHLDASYLERDTNNYDEEPFTYHGQKFSGIAYDFEDDFCTRELLCLNGKLDSEVSYYLSGQLESVDLNDANFWQECNWFKDGQIENISLYEKNSFDVSIKFTKTGKIKTLTLDGEYFNRFAALKERIKFPVLDSKSYLKDIVSADRLFLSGSAVDDEILDNLVSNKGMSEINELSIFNTSLSEKSLDQLKTLKTIKSLCIKGKNISLNKLQHLKKESPSWIIKYDNEEVTVI